MLRVPNHRVGRQLPWLEAYDLPQPADPHRVPLAVRVLARVELHGVTGPVPGDADLLAAVTRPDREQRRPHSGFG